MSNAVETLKGWLRTAGTGRASLALALLGGTLGPALAGCQQNPAPPPRAEVPRVADDGSVRERDQVRPLPEQADGDLPPPPFDDPPLVSQRPPEQAAFVEAYERVGRPRIIVFVNRTLEGQIVPVNQREPLVTVQRTRTASDDVEVQTESSETEEGRFSAENRSREDRFRTEGPAEYRDTVEVYLQPGQYDEVLARQIDYGAMETGLTGWIAADGQTEVVSPIMARQRLTDQQVRELQSGRPRVLGEIARELDADVLIQVQAHPTEQTQQGLKVRVLAEAINVKRGGQSIGRAFVDVPPPMDKPKINKFTRYLARKLMDDMTATWESVAAGGGAGQGGRGPGAGLGQPEGEEMAPTDPGDDLPPGPDDEPEPSGGGQSR